jgi:hypothetical protein
LEGSHGHTDLGSGSGGREAAVRAPDEAVLDEWMISLSHG